jgi:hypothetical protein
MITGHVITTKYLGPTNFKGQRISAKCWKGSAIVHYDSALSSRDAHQKAAEALAERHGFGKIVAGGEEEHGYVFICSR